MNTVAVTPFQPTVFGAMKRYAVLVVATVAGAGLVGVLLGESTRGSEVSATASIVVADPNASGGGGTHEPNYPATQASIIMLPSTAERAARLVNSQVPGVRLAGTEFHRHVKAATTTDSSLIKVSFSGRDPKVAVAGANAAVTAYLGILSDRARRTRDDTLRRLAEGIRELDWRIRTTGDTDPTSPDHGAKAGMQARQIQVLSEVDGGGISAVSPATRPDDPSNPPLLRYGLIAALAGLLPAAGTSYLVASRRRRFSHPLEPELVTERPLLAEIADFRAERPRTDLPALDRPASAAAEGFRFALHSLDASPGRGYAVVSAAHDLSTSLATANIAVTAAAAGKRVLAIDGNLAGGHLSRLLGMAPNKPGLVHLLREDVGLEGAVHRVTSLSGQLWLMPGGATSAAAGELFGGVTAADVFEALKEEYDLVLVDCPAMFQTAGAAWLAHRMDAILLVVPHGSDVGQLEEMSRRTRMLAPPVRGYLYNYAVDRGPRGPRSAYRRADVAPVPPGRIPAQPAAG